MSHPYETLRILAVDDNRTNLHILQVFLRKMGHEVTLAENGEQAVQLFKQSPPDLVLLDIMMPVMDGFEAARQIKAASLDKWVPVIFLSALNRDENLVEGLEAGADDYLTKPINFVVLEAKIRSMQRSLRLQQAALDSAHKLKTISDNVLDAIITADMNLRIGSVNKAAELMFGWAADEIVGQSISVLMSSQDMAHHRQISGQEIEVRQREGLGRHRDGREFPVEVSATLSVLDEQRLYVALIRDISDRKAAELQLQANAKQLQAYYDHSQNERQLALRLMEKILHRPGLQDQRLRYMVVPTENFSGDIVAAARSPEGRFYVLLADGTGHGLPAAISVLPVLALFYRMTRQNRPIREIITEINQQLRESVPVGRFVAATIACLDEISLQGEIWVGGTPEAYLIDRWGKPSQIFTSENLALGIVDSKELDCQPRRFQWTPESQLVVCSDGLLEAANTDGVQFGNSGLLAAIANVQPTERFQSIRRALEIHLNGQPANDDVSLMLIDCP